MENSETAGSVLQTYQESLYPFKGVLINVTIVRGACSSSRRFGPSRMKTQLDPGELEGKKIFGWLGEGRENLVMKKGPGGEPSGSARSEKA